MYEGLVDDRGKQGLFRVRTDVFRDREIFEAERERVLHRSWLYVGHESEVPEVGDFVSRSVGGHPVIMVRQDDRSIKVLYNTCAHQQMQVCRVPRGNTASFNCFFHGWTYNRSGQLTGLPGRESYQGEFRMEDHGLREPRVGDHRGFVFMCSSMETPELGDYLGPARAYLDLVADQGDMQVLPGTHRYVTHANWKMATMNSNDGYHVQTTHSTYLAYLRSEGIDTGARKLGRRPLLGNGHTASEFFGGWGRPIARWAAYWPDDLEPRLEAKERELTERFGQERTHLMTQVDRNLIVFPNLVINDHSAIIIRTWEPLAVDRIVVSAWCLAPKEEPADIRRLRMKNYLTFFGPAGFATPDDVEALEGIQYGFRNDAMEWLDLSKGAFTEDDPEVDNNADEDQLRAFWRRWEHDMTTEPSTPELASV